MVDTLLEVQPAGFEVVVARKVVGGPCISFLHLWSRSIRPSHPHIAQEIVPVAFVDAANGSLMAIARPLARMLLRELQRARPL